VKISERAYLRALGEGDAGELQALIERNRERLSRWFDWAASQTLDDTVAFVRACEAQAAADDGLQAAIVSDGAIVGVVGFPAVDWRRRSTTLGYWLDAAHEGRGLMTRAARILVDRALGAWELHRVEIRVAVENGRSRAVAERLGFRHEGTLRAAERVGDRFLDSAVYGMLASDWTRAS
jgi:ribosomal-protein-serine acetyltransferase